MSESISLPDIRSVSEDAKTAKYPSSSDTELLVDADSDESPMLSVILPTLNEEQGIATCIDQITTAIETLGCTAEIIVADNSTDRTPEIARELGAIVISPDRKGYGYAYQCAFQRARGEYLVIGDADTTYDFEAIPRLLAPVIDGEADICMGSRFEGEIEAGAMPALHRYVGNPLLTGFLNLFYDAGVTDAHSGFRVLSREALETLTLKSDGMEFASEMVMEAAAKDLEIEEVPITYHERTGDETLDSFRDGWRHVEFMLVNAPGYLFFVPGLLMVLLGGLIMFAAAFDVSVVGVGFGIHSMIAGSLFTIVGYQIASLGVFATVAGDPIRRPSDLVTTWLLSHDILEYRATLGVGLFAVGSLYTGYLLIRWIESGFSRLPFVMEDVVAFTLIVLGVQTVFGSFFMSAITWHE